MFRWQTTPVATSRLRGPHRARVLPDGAEPASPSVAAPRCSQENGKAHVNLPPPRPGVPMSGLAGADPWGPVAVPAG